MKIRQTVTILAVLVVLFAGVTGVMAQTSTSQPPPHHMGPPPPPSVCTDGKYLFVVIGPKILVYTVPDLTLQNSADLPRPTPPTSQ